MAKIDVCIIRPPLLVDCEALREIAESLCYALLRLGHRSTIVENRFPADTASIVLGAHLLGERALEVLPASAIVYNLEQIGPDTARDNPGYLELLRQRRVWDYSERNLEAYAALGAKMDAALLPVGYVPELARIQPAPEQDIDVLFYGSLNDRRRKVLEEITGAGLNTQAAFGIYGQARDELIARAKLVLNLHFYPARLFEIVRVSYLLANRKAVVSESSELAASETDLADALRFAPPEDLPDLCVELAYDAEQRRALEQQGYATFSARRLEDSLAKLVGTAVYPAAGPQVRYPLKLNIGSGRDWREDCLNLDISAQWRPDAVLDIGQPCALPLELETARFGHLALHENMFDEITASHVLEHIHDLPTAMTNFLRLLKPGGALRVHVPYDLSYGAWQDPTHVRAFNERSWAYYTNWFWYFGWTEHRFDLTDLQYALSPIGLQAQERGIPVEEILRLPRAVDEMKAVLRKVFLTEEEVRAGARMRGDARAAGA